MGDLDPLAARRALQALRFQARTGVERTSDYPHPDPALAFTHCHSIKPRRLANSWALADTRPRKERYLTAPRSRRIYPASKRAGIQDRPAATSPRGQRAVNQPNGQRRPTGWSRAAAPAPDVSAVLRGTAPYLASGAHSVSSRPGALSRPRVTPRISWNDRRCSASPPAG